ncbi:MAG TPA: hypothetical protein DEA47_06210 [Peptococcaceae bacterium]|nr:MAG: Uncharacterized protein XD50_0853 [Clostridia bacterium 41_269]HBT20933.1 hypothetical protein [Peptococcaceae bacterium]
MQRQRSFIAFYPWVVFIFSLILLLFMLFGPPAWGKLPVQKPRAVIVYETKSLDTNKYFDLTAAMGEYLAHFDVEVLELARKDWEKGKLKGFSLVVYLGTRETTLSSAMLEEMSSAPAVLWLGYNIEDYAKFARWDNFKFFGRSNYFVRLKVGSSFEMDIDPYTPLYIADPGKEAEITSYVSNIKELLPLSWQKGNVYYLGSLDFVFPYNILTGELLHKILDCGKERTYRVLLRIEDVSPLTDPNNLQKLIDVAAYHNIPYAVAVIPFDYHRGQRVGLSSKKELIKVLRRVYETGGAIIMHGCEHSNRYSPKTGEGFEFWNSKDDLPMENDADFTKSRIEMGLKEFAKAGVYPVAFEAPHYSMSSTGYKVLSQYFSTYVGQIQLSDETYKASLELPFAVNSIRLNGMRVWPETFGYVEPNDVLAYDKIRKLARFFKILPHAETCVFYHGFLPPEGLERLIEIFKEEGYGFASLLEEEFWVKSRYLKVWGSNGSIKWESSIEAVNPDRKDPLYRGPEFVVKGVMGLALLAASLVVFFSLIVWRLRRRRSRLYEAKRVR